MISRRCSRAGCGRSAAATLTYVYADSTAVLGPLALRAEPGCYELCDEHAGRLSAPRGWEVIRLPSGTTDQRAGTDLTALADAIRQVGLGTAEPPAELAVTRRKGHLAILADPAQGPSR